MAFFAEYRTSFGAVGLVNAACSSVRSSGRNDVYWPPAMRERIASFVVTA